MFKKLSSNLANDLVQKLPAADNKFGNKSAKDYCNNMFNFYPKKLTFQTIQTRYISDLLKHCGTNKAAGIDDLSGRFLKNDADILTIPITQLCNLSIKFSHFPKDCKVAKSSLFTKKELNKTDPKNFRPISLLRKSNTRSNYELFNREQHSLQKPIWVLQEPLNKHFSCIFDR